MNHNQRYRFVKGISVVLLGLAACGEGEESEAVGAADDKNKAVCATLLSCATALKSDGAAVWGPLYGNDGSCWKAQSGEQCGQQCKTQLTGILPESPANMTEDDLKACGVSSCSSDADCEVFLKARVCDTELKICAGCTTDMDCGGTEGACQGFIDDTGTSVPCAQATDACFCAM